MHRLGTHRSLFGSSLALLGPSGPCWVRAKRNRCQRGGLHRVVQLTMVAFSECPTCSENHESGRMEASFASLMLTLRKPSPSSHAPIRDNDSCTLTCLLRRVHRRVERNV